MMQSCPAVASSPTGTAAALQQGDEPWPVVGRQHASAYSGATQPVTCVHQQLRCLERSGVSVPGPDSTQLLGARHVVRHSPPARSAPGAAGTRPSCARTLLMISRRTLTPACSKLQLPLPRRMVCHCVVLQLLVQRWAGRWHRVAWERHCTHLNAQP